MPIFKFEKEKYLQLAESDGVQAALTRLHQDTIEWEYQAFEGRDGYQPQMWQELQRVRDFSRELWEISLMSQAPKSDSQ